MAAPRNLGDQPMTAQLGQLTGELDCAVVLFSLRMG